MNDEIKDLTSDVPGDIIEAVKKIEQYTKSRTYRDDWAIGDITCRRGAERLLKMYKDSVKKLNKIEQTLKE